MHIILFIDKSKRVNFEHFEKQIMALFIHSIHYTT